LGKILGLKQNEFQGILEKLGSRQKFWDIVGAEPQATARIRHKIAILTKNVYICGKYIKYSRYLSQTPWLVNGRKLTEGSLQE
jgi:tRNA U54 and U55 pseudouridine synthase Pus10